MSLSSKIKAGSSLILPANEDGVSLAQSFFRLYSLTQHFSLWRENDCAFIRMQKLNPKSPVLHCPAT